MQNKGEAEIASDPVALITDKVDGFVDGFFYQSPNIAAGIALILAAGRPAGASLG